MDTLSKTLRDTEEEIDKVEKKSFHAISLYSALHMSILIRMITVLYSVQLAEHKERVEKALEAKTMPLEVALGCLALREGRVAIDLVRDEVEAQLHKVWMGVFRHDDISKDSNSLVMTKINYYNLENSAIIILIIIIY